MKKKVVGVLMGGVSSEREVSFKTGEAIVTALGRLSYPVRRIIVDDNIVEVLSHLDIDVAFIALHGTFGEDGCIQGLLEILGIPYTGSGVMASALAMDKLKSKELFRLHNLPTPPYYVIRAGDMSRIEELHGSFGFPVIVKPRREGSSVGISVIRKMNDLYEAVEKAMKWDEDVIIERYINGKEIAVGLLDGRVLGAIEVVPDGEFYDYNAKYNSKKTNYFFPARLSPTRYRCVLTLAEHANKVLGCSGTTRVDLIVTEGENEYVLELNSLPGMMEKSLLPKIAAGAGYSFESLIEAVLKGAVCHSSAVRPGPRGRVKLDEEEDRKVVNLPVAGK